MKKSLKIFLIFFIIVICIICIIFIGINYIRNHPQQVKKNKREMVEAYVLQEYNIDGKIKASWFTHNEDGFTGGLFIYRFKAKDVNGKNFFIEYYSYEDLSNETLDNLEIKYEETIDNS